MDIATLIGIVAGFGLILASILIGSPLSAFFNVPGLLIVVGGTIATTLISETMEHTIGSIKVAKNAFRKGSSNTPETIKKIIELSTIARKEGVLALEKQQIEDAFLSKAIRMVVDNLPPEEIHETLVAELVSMKSRHIRGQKLFRFMGGSAPAMGMIGTLIGLVQMLRNMSDPSSIGPAMAIALLTTLYGSIIAFVICNPIADKLEKRTGDETIKMTMVIDGVQSILKGHASGIIKDKLEARLAPKEREPSDAEGKAA